MWKEQYDDKYVEIKDKIMQQCEILLRDDIKNDILKNNLPEFIKHQYEYLYKIMIKNGQIYSGFYQIKDLFELNLKLPLIIFLAGMNDFIIKNNITGEDFGDNRRYHKNIKDIFYQRVLGKLPALGDWETACQALEKIKDQEIDKIPIEKSHQEFYLCLLKIIRILSSKYFNFRSRNSNNNVTISSYRNDMLGHGATNLDYEDFYEEFKHFLNALNSVLIQTNYNKNIKFDEDGDYLRISYNGVHFELKHYIEILNDDKTGISVLMMESFNERKQAAYLLNYNNGRKDPDLNLYSTLAEIKNERFGVNDISDTEIDAEDVDMDDYQSLFGKRRIVVENSIFFQCINEFINSVKQKNGSKGILNIKADPGMGKTIFARTITDNELEKIDVESSNWAALNESGYLIWSYFIDEFNGSSMSFFIERIVSFIEKNLYQAGHRREYLNKRGALYSYKKQGLNPKKVWGDYFTYVLNKLKSKKPESKLLIVIDGKDSVNHNYLDVFKFDEIFDLEYLPDDMFIIVLERGDNSGSASAKYDLIEEVDSSKNLILGGGLFEEVVISKKSELYKDVLLNYVKEIIRRSKIKQLMTAMNSEFIENNDISIAFYNKVIEYANYSFANLSVLTKVIENNPLLFVLLMHENDNENKNIGIISSYLKCFQFAGERYLNDVQRALVLFNNLKSPIKIEELNFLLFNDSSDIVTYRLNAFKNDILEFLEYTNNDNGKLFCMKNKIWKKELDGNNFTNITSSVLADIQERIDLLLTEFDGSDSYIINNYGILLFDEFLMEDKIQDPNISNKVLRYISILQCKDISEDKYYQRRIINILNKIEEYLLSADDEMAIRLYLNKATAFCKIGDFSQSLLNLKHVYAALKNNHCLEDISLLYEIAKRAKVILMLNDYDGEIVIKFYKKLSALINTIEENGGLIPDLFKANVYLKYAHIADELNRQDIVERELKRAQKYIKDESHILYLELLCDYTKFYSVEVLKTSNSTEHKKYYDLLLDYRNRFHEIIMEKNIEKCTIKDVHLLLSSIEYEFLLSVDWNRQEINVNYLLEIVDKAFKIYSKLFDKKRIVKTLFDEITLASIYYIYSLCYYFDPYKKDNSCAKEYFIKFEGIMNNQLKNNHNRYIQRLYSQSIRVLEMIDSEDAAGFNHVHKLNTTLNPDDIKAFMEVQGLETILDKSKRGTGFKRDMLQKICNKLEKIVDFNITSDTKDRELQIVSLEKNILFEHVQNLQTISKVNILHKLADSYFNFSLTYEDFCKKNDNAYEKHRYVSNAILLYEALLNYYNHFGNAYVKEHRADIMENLIQCYSNMIMFYTKIEIDNHEAVSVVDKIIMLYKILLDINNGESDNILEFVKEVYKKNPKLRGTNVQIWHNIYEENISRFLLVKFELLREIDDKSSEITLVLKEAIAYLEKTLEYFKKLSYEYPIHFSAQKDEIISHLCQAYIFYLNYSMLKRCMNEKNILVYNGFDNEFIEKVNNAMYIVKWLETNASNIGSIAFIIIAKVLKIFFNLLLENYDIAKVALEEFKFYESKNLNKLADLDKVRVNEIVTNVLNAIDQMIVPDLELKKKYVELNLKEEFQELTMLGNKIEQLCFSESEINKKLLLLGNPSVINIYKYYQFKQAKNMLTDIELQKQDVQKKMRSKIIKIDDIIETTEHKKNYVHLLEKIRHLREFYVMINTNRIMSKNGDDTKISKDILRYISNFKRQMSKK